MDESIIKNSSNEDFKNLDPEINISKKFIYTSPENEENVEFEDDLDFDTEDESGDELIQNEKLKEEEELEDEKIEDEDSKCGKSEHDGKLFVIQKGMCQCNQGFKFPKFKVTSHQKHYWNSEKADADYLAVTEDDLIFDPTAMPFGNCKLQPTSNGYLPCTYAPVGKWQKPYEKVKVMGKSCLTEKSELMCSIGGKITILKHGQQSEASKSNVKKAKAHEQHIFNPILNFEEFQEEIGDDEAQAW